MSLFSRHVELYEFGRGSQRWRYTSSDRAEIYDSQQFVAVAMKRGRLGQSAQEARSNLEVTVPLSLPLASVLRPFPPTERITVRWLRVRKNDGVIRDTWNGVLSDFTERQNDLVLTCQSNIGAAATNGLRRCWQGPCPFALFDEDCGLNPELFRIDGVLSAASTITIASAAFAAKPDGWFVGGFVKWKNGAATEYRFVVAHAGPVLTLLTAAPLAAGELVSAYPGCGHALQVCHEKFNNALKFGGQHTIPKKNPFGPDPIF
ncbi:phage BR0599 family protein [Stenotrophomonas maltophilia]|nr:phage BR0599 family protein [Stenotrophomonas maltophilia]MBN5012405.1 phage BR0599 family protein [Stenotrophomonas maltophilia]